MSPEQADTNSQLPPETFGLTDDDVAIRRTVFASDALRDMVVVVTGATGGIGRAIAWLFARLGSHVVLVGRNKTKLDALTARMAQRSLNVSSYAADIRAPDAVRALF